MMATPETDSIRVIVTEFGAELVSQSRPSECASIEQDIARVIEMTYKIDEEMMKMRDEISRMNKAFDQIRDLAEWF